jgi:glycosyltransferase involved in cell wall biosynthesis
MVDPYDVAALSNAIRTIDHDADLRTELTARGIKRASNFTPEKYRENLKALYSRFV